MGAVKICAFSLFFKSDGRTGPFNHCTTYGNEQRFYPCPFDISVYRVIEYGFKRFSVFAVHGEMITFGDIISKKYYCNICDCCDPTQGRISNPSYMAVILYMTESTDLFLVAPQLFV